MRGLGPDGERSRRGQSEVLGVALLLGITIVGVAAVVALGGDAVDQTRHTMEVSAAADAMAQLDSEASRVALGWSDAQRVDFGRLSGDGRVYVVEDGGWMNVSVNNATTGELKYLVMNRTLGSVVYENGETTIAYQGGGVWRGSGEGSVMISPPEVHYRGTTLTLPLVVVNSDESVGSQVVVRRGGPTTAQFPTDEHHNPLTEGVVNVTVHSAYYRGWGAFFAQRTDGRVYYDHANRTVTLQLLISGSLAKVTGAVVSGASGDSLQISNNAYVDSYNSSKSPGTYPENKSTNGTIRLASGLKLDNGAIVKGTVNSGGGTVEMDNHARITGDLYYAAPPDISRKATVEGQTYPNGTAPDVAPVGSLVDRKVDDLASADVNNNSEEAEDITDENLLDDSAVDGECTWELGPGKYYLQRLDVGNEKTLCLDTTTGNVTIAVENDIQLDNDARIVVEGDGVARVYMDDDQFKLDNGAEVTNAGMDSPQFWLYAPPGLQAQFDNNARFVGVVYAPSSSDDGQITLSNGAEVYGGLVGRVTQVDNNAAIHFDEALLREQPLPDYASLPRLTYLHVSTNPINVTSAA